MSDGTIVFSVPEEDLDATGRVLLEAGRWCKTFYAEEQPRMKGRWKSVKKDGNPLLPGMYLVTVEFKTTYAGILKRYVDCLEYTPDSKWVNTDEEGDDVLRSFLSVIAWMENPEVYHGQ